MEERYLPALVTLIASAVACTICIIKSFDVVQSLKIIFLVLIIFYIIGLAAKIIISRTLKNSKENDITKDVKEDDMQDTIREDIHENTHDDNHEEDGERKV